MRIVPQVQCAALMRPQRQLRRIGAPVPQLPAALLDLCRGGGHGKGDVLVLIVRLRDPRQRPHLRIGELAFGERPADRRQRLQRMRDAHFLARRVL